MATVRGDWRVFESSGQAVAEAGSWWLRWDLSPLGFLKTAAHGHLDALHLSIWRQGVALVVDPGTGAYHADRRVRDWLASRSAHNGPCPQGPESPRRLGAFLWAHHHPKPSLEESSEGWQGRLELPEGTAIRTIQRLVVGDGWRVLDGWEPKGDRVSGSFTVRWQFAPGTRVRRISERQFSIERADVALMMEVSEGWSTIDLKDPGDAGTCALLAPGEPLDGLVSPGFRALARAPFLRLTAPSSGDKTCVFTTTFLASQRS